MRSVVPNQSLPTFRRFSLWSSDEPLCACFTKAVSLLRECLLGERFTGLILDTSRMFALVVAILLFIGSEAPVSGQTFTNLANFNLNNGSYPTRLIQGSDGNFYGTTYYGGSSTACNTQYNTGCGTVFRMTPTGVLTTLVNFNSNNGSVPYYLIQGSDGNFYGTTAYGGLMRDNLRIF